MSQEEHVFLRFANARKGGHTTKNKPQANSLEREHGSFKKNNKEVLPPAFSSGFKKLRIQQPPPVQSKPIEN